MVREEEHTPRFYSCFEKSGFTDEERSCCSDSLVSELFFDDSENAICENDHMRDQAIEEPWLLQSSSRSCICADLETSRDPFNYVSHSIINNKSEFDVNGKEISQESCDYLSTSHPVEEPWLLGCSPVKMVSDMPANTSKNEQFKDENPLSVLSDQHLLLPQNEGIVLPQEEPPDTVILINSSICSMQRIAVLENNRLVELLLEPVKNNVQCDSIYLGTVTKLAPHMGGAFVNIGSPRPSFMDINRRREPFILPHIHGHLKEGNLMDSMFDTSGDHEHFQENRSFSDEAEESDELEDDQSEDEFFDDEPERKQSRFNLDVLEVIKENINGSVVEHDRPADEERFLEQLDGDRDQLQGKSIQQDTSNVDTIVTKESEWKKFQKGCKIIVQVIKEGLGTKGPTLTPYPVLRSRFWVLITRCKTIGISKKIAGSERTRLRVIAKTLQPPGFGVTVRTVASGHSIEELQKDLEGLLLTWENIVEHARSAALAADEGIDGAVPVILHRAMGQTLSVVQDYFNEKVKAMVVDSPRTYHEVTNYLQKIDPNLCDRTELYSKKNPLFDEYNIEKEINDILSKRVPLTNGGYLVIEQTEALVSIDVNGGNCMLGQGTSQEKAILAVNLAAAKQIARELRLRDIGGIIVVDFIDMMDDSNKRLVYEEIKKAVERDRSNVKVSELSRHGLMEITRKRVRPSVTFMISEPCSCCHATGRVEALETSFSKIEHEICRLLAIMDRKANPENAKSWPRFILRVDRHMCNYLTSGKRTRLAVLSSSLKVWILLKVARGLTRGTFELKPLTDYVEPNNECQTVLSVLRPTEAVTYAPNPKVTLLPIKWKTGRK